MQSSQPQSNNSVGRTMAAVVAGVLVLGVGGLLLSVRGSSEKTEALATLDIAGVAAIDAESVLVTRRTRSSDAEGEGASSELSWTMARFDAGKATPAWEHAIRGSV